MRGLIPFGDVATMLRSLFRCDRGAIAPYGIVAAVPLLLAAGFAVDYSDSLRKRSDLQARLDGAVLAGAASEGNKPGEALNFFLLTSGLPDAEAQALVNGNRISFNLQNDRLAGRVTKTFERPFAFGRDAHYDMTVEAAVRLRSAGPAGPCINVLGNVSQALLLNSGAKIDAPNCEIHVHSTRNPAFIMNAGVDMKIANLCVKGTNFIRNGGTVTKMQTACNVMADPYAGKIPEPAVPASCQTSGARDGSSHTLNPGMHCQVNFNGSPTITFRPGLHIIRGSMNINSGATVIAEGVTFYFPDRDSRIQANGALTMRATAPTSGAYKDILMFEKTSGAGANPSTGQYVFNGSRGESLQGVIYLPFRNVTYNSTTNISGSNISMVVNTMIVNSANWTFEGAGGTSAATSFYLSR